MHCCKWASLIKLFVDRIKKNYGEWPQIMKPVTSYKPVVMWMDDDYHPDSFQTWVEYGSRRDDEMKCVLHKYDAMITVYLDLERSLIILIDAVRFIEVSFKSDNYWIFPYACYFVWKWSVDIRFETWMLFPEERILSRVGMHPIQ